MKTNISQRKRRVEADIEELEAKLQAALQPVTPRDGFIYDLRSQLASRPNTPAEKSLFSSGNLLVILASLLGGVVLLIFGARGIRSLIQALNRLEQEKMPMPANPV